MCATRDFDDRAEVAGEGGAEVSPEAFVQGFQGPHLVFGDALGPLEVVDLDVDLRSAVRAERRAAASVPTAAPARYPRRRAGHRLRIDPGHPSSCRQPPC